MREAARRAFLGPGSALLLVAMAATTPAFADATPEQLQFAAQEHDLGYRAFQAKQYDEAAVHFENAFFAAPNPAELRAAVRARKDAGEKARAATLAAIGQRKFPGDAAVAKLADETINAVRADLFEVKVSSPLECNAVVDSKIVANEKAKAFRFFVDPGHHEVSVGWGDERSTKVALDATAGGSKTLELTPPPPPPKPVHSVDGVGATPEPSKPFGPIVFLVGAGLTAVAGGVTIWSGIDTQNNPGPNAVKADCVGQGTSCPQYQQGLSSQLRTNILIATTGGLAALTAVVGVFFTQWHHAPEAESPPASGLRVTPVLGPGEAAIVGTF